MRNHGANRGNGGPLPWRHGSGSPGYHLRELRIALDETSPAHSLPPLRDSAAKILDVGCGAGQTVSALGLDPAAQACGVDPDPVALRLATDVAPGLRVSAAIGEALPFSDGHFEWVVSRVCLPYTDIPKSLAEIYRVLAPGGRVWMTLHSASFTLRCLLQNATRGRLLAALFRLYVLANGTMLHLFGFAVRVPFSNGLIESFQTVGRMRKLLRGAGFTDLVLQNRGHHFTVTAKRPSARLTEGQALKGVPVVSRRTPAPPLSER